MRSGGALFATPVTTARDVRSQAILACDPRQDFLCTRSHAPRVLAPTLRVGVSSGRSASLPPGRCAQPAVHCSSRRPSWQVARSARGGWHLASGAGVTPQSGCHEFLE